jgi:hypothetical protein
VNKTSGVIYYNKGHKCIVRLIVSLQSLRQHYAGPTSIFWEGEAPAGLLDALRKEFAVDIIHDDNPEIGVYVRAVDVCMRTPYDLTVWMDADTLILGPFQYLFEKAGEHDLVIAHFAGWKSSGPSISRRIRRYQEIAPQYMEAAVNYGPAINCGVYAFPKHSRMLPEWLEVSKKGEKTGMFIPDEVACQVLLPRYNVHIAPTRYNVSVIHDPGTEDIRIIHYHGRKHTIDCPKAKLWLEAFDRCVHKNLCGIRQYTDRRYGDRRLNWFLGGAYGNLELAESIGAILSKENGLDYKNEPRRRGRRGQTPPEAEEMERLGDEEDAARAEQGTDTRPAQTGQDVETKPARKEIPAGEPTAPSPPLDEVTVVTACDVKYVEMLRLTYPNWCQFKNIHLYPMLLFVHGMEVADPRLDFLKRDRLTIIPWAMPQAADHREEMLTAFVLGTARHVQTKYWLKLDADALAENYRPLLTEEMKQYVFCGHRWGYSFTKHIRALDAWAQAHPDKTLRTAQPMYDPKCDQGRRYYHPKKRTISFVQLQDADFTRFCARLAGNRLPVPSHDTYLFYIADRFGFPHAWKNFKRFFGFTQCRGVDDICQHLEKLPA